VTASKEPAANKKSNGTPNIVLITVDQLAAAVLHCYGGRTESTSTLDALAASGRRHDRCYAHSPLCAPNRATMLTGRSLAFHGVAHNNLVLDERHPTYARVLQSVGYRTGAFGKFHLTPMQQPLPRDFAYLGYDESVGTEDTKLGPWFDWIEREHPAYREAALAMCWPVPYLSAYGEEGLNRRPEWEAAYRRWLEPRMNASEWRLMYGSPLPQELHQTTYITDLTLDFMERHRSREGDRPFFCHASYVDPHDPYDPPTPYDTMFDPADMELPIVSAHHAPPDSVLAAARSFHAFERVADDPAAMRKLRALYHGSLRFLDDQVKRIVEWLEREGLTERTMIVFTSDHGDMLGDHGYITKGVMHYDKSIRCPLLVSGPGVEAGTISDRLTSSLDLFPTFCEWAGVELAPPLEGRSFANVGTAGDERNGCSSTHGGTAGGSNGVSLDGNGWREVTVEVNGVRSVVTDDGWRLTVYADEPDCNQLFHLAGDPDELHNLYGSDDPAHLARKAELMERHIRAYMRPMAVQSYRDLPTVGGAPHLVREFDLLPTWTRSER
jgi:arylsulfatase